MLTGASFARAAQTGAYIDFGETEDRVTAAAIVAFEAAVGRKQAIVASSSYWGKGDFPLANVRLIAAHGATPLIYWSPWGPPYEQGKHVKPGAFALERIAAGECDPYIDRWAAAAREFGGPLIVSFACEPNADWFPWGHKPEAYRAAYRHVVDRARSPNISWVFHANNDSHPAKSWNAMSAYYPGPGYVDWLALSVYGQLTPDDGWTSWSEAMDVPYRELCALDPGKPVMLAEWGVGEFPKSGNRAKWIRDAFAAMNARRYPRLRAAIFWSERWQNKDESFSDLRVDASPASLKAYRDGVADPFWNP